ncbi:hypothetical protein Syun_028647 [Stephania yunnanensis]|uniref:Uncharacterized protein n=1 Tax=Stephania yunnanensis TaxID=152371 RepID=A0AAP0E769_9MAGN
MRDRERERDLKTKMSGREEKSLGGERISGESRKTLGGENEWGVSVMWGEE